MGLPKAPKVEGRVVLEDKEVELFMARASVGACHPQRSETAVLRCNLEPILYGRCLCPVFCSKEDPKKGALLTYDHCKTVAAGSS